MPIFEESCNLKRLCVAGILERKQNSSFTAPCHLETIPSTPLIRTLLKWSSRLQPLNCVPAKKYKKYW